MAFELTKAKLEARAAKRKAIGVMDKYICALSISVVETEDPEIRNRIIEEIKKWVELRDLYKKRTELPKWAQELITTSLKLITLVGSVVACEIITNRGTGDKLIIDCIKKVPGV